VIIAYLEGAIAGLIARCCRAVLLPRQVDFAPSAISSKSYWHLSRTLATQVGMTNDWLTAQGLISIRALWVKVHGYA
jgi:hypothetical protein